MSHNKLSPRLAAALSIPVDIMRRCKSESRETKLTVVLVLVYPTVSFVSFHHELVVTESSIDECVDECTSQITASRVHIGSSRLYRTNRSVLKIIHNTQHLLVVSRCDL